MVIAVEDLILANDGQQTTCHLSSVYDEKLKCYYLRQMRILCGISKLSKRGLDLKCRNQTKDTRLFHPDHNGRY